MIRQLTVFNPAALQHFEVNYFLLHQTHFYKTEMQQKRKFTVTHYITSSSCTPTTAATKKQKYFLHNLQSIQFLNCTASSFANFQTLSFGYCNSSMSYLFWPFSWMCWCTRAVFQWSLCLRCTHKKVMVNVRLTVGGHLVECTTPLCNPDPDPNPTSNCNSSPKYCYQLIGIYGIDDSSGGPKSTIFP